MSDMKGIGYQAYMQYLLDHKNDTGTEDDTVSHCESRKKVLMIVMQFLCQCRPPDRFRYSEFTNLILDAAGIEDFDPQKVSQAFENLEKYLILLYIMPWKQEYHKIKTYCGFYKAKLESHIPKADVILKLVGFSEMKPGLLVLSQGANIDNLQYIAYECFVASVECSIMYNIWQKVQGMKLSLFQLVQVRCKNAGSIESTVKLIETKFGKAISPPPALDMGSPRGCGEAQLNKVPPTPSSATTVFRDRLQGHLNAVKKLSDDPDIPFMDDTPADLDDHLMASMHIVTASEKHGEEPVKGSQEWSFVREKLEKNYGKKYFDGPRKDILNGQDDIGTGKKKKEYVQVMAQHTYENVPNKGNITKSEPIRSRGSDQNAAYHFAEQNNAFYPPTIHKSSPAVANVVPMQRKQSATETILHRDSHLSAQEMHAPRYRTEPLAVRVDPVPNVSQTYPPQLVTGKQPPNAQENLENILKYHKQNVLKNTEQAAAYCKSPLVSVAPLTSIRSQATTESRVNTSGYGSHSGTISTKSSTPEQASVVAQQERGTWSCHQCTFRNQDTTDTCEICLAKRTCLETDSEVTSTNVCPRCTVVNQESFNQCSVCGYNLRMCKTI